MTGVSNFDYYLHNIKNITLILFVLEASQKICNTRANGNCNKTCGREHFIVKIQSRVLPMLTKAPTITRTKKNNKSLEKKSFC